MLFYLRTMIPRLSLRQATVGAIIIVCFSSLITYYAQTDVAISRLFETGGIEINMRQFYINMIEHLVILLSFFLGKKICLKCFGVKNEKYNLEITGALEKSPSKWRIKGWKVRGLFGKFLQPSSERNNMCGGGGGGGGGGGWQLVFMKLLMSRCLRERERERERELVCTLQCILSLLLASDYNLTLSNN